MSRARWFEVWKIVIVTIAVALLAWSLATRSLDEWPQLLALSALVLVAAFLRIDSGAAPIGFEAAIVFGALVVFHTPAVAVIAVMIGMGAHAIWSGASERRLTLDRVYQSSQMTISYALVGVLYATAVHPQAPVAARMAGFVLLLGGYAAALLLFAFVRRYFEEPAAGVDVRRLMLLEARTLVVVLPIVAIEVMLYPSWGVAGFAVAFVPVVVVAWVMRNESEASKQNVELVRRNRELAILTESSTQILSAESDQEALRRLMTLLSKLAKMKASAVVTWEPNPDVPATVYRYGECMPTDQDILRWVDSAGFAQSAPSRAFVFQSDMRRFPLSSAAAIQVLIGIQTPEVIYGILLFETEDPSILKAGSLNLLTLLVNQTALSIQHQLLRREMHEKTIQLEHQAETMSTISNVSRALIGNFDLEMALTQIAQAVRDTVGFERVVFALLSPAGDEFVRRAHAGMDEVWEDARRKPVPLSEIEPFLQPEFRVSSSFFVPHTAQQRSERDVFVHQDDDERFLKPDEWHENDILLVPLEGEEGISGYLWVRDPVDGRRATIDQIRTLEIFAALAQTALQSSRQYEQIRRLTFIDSLTGAYNHRYLQEALEKELSRHRRHGNELTLMLMDIDSFKKVNDTWGHLVGDEILRGIVAELMAQKREPDILARYGGEEFVMIFPETPMFSAATAADRMRALIEKREFHVPQLDAPLRMTISAGVAVFPHDGEQGGDLLARADAALYVAKKSGKNRVALARDVLLDDCEAG